MSKIVLALGGNALGNTAAEQISRCRVAAKAIADLICEGHTLVVAHGNGPQVGQIRLAFETAEKHGTGPNMPFAECTAMSQGYIGFHLQNCISEELCARGQSGKPVVTMLTQVVVDESDPAFGKPSKPVGGYYTEAEAKNLMDSSGDIYKEDAGRGWRRVVPSPLPVDIIELRTLLTLIDTDHVVVACGGGGIPVVKRGGTYAGVDAVIDKDYAAEKMAELVDADVFIILTAVEKICLRYNTPEQTELDTMKLADAKRYISEGHFAPGSMLPKVQAACKFLDWNGNRKVIVTSLVKAAAALNGESGTTITG